MKKNIVVFFLLFCTARIVSAEESERSLALHFALEGKKEEAIEMFQRAIKGGSNSTISTYIVYLTKWGEIERGIEFLRPLALSGNPYAQNGLGVCCYSMKQYEEAFQCYSKASEQKFALATLYLSELYANGLFVKQDLNRALELAELAGSQDGDKKYIKLIEEAISEYNAKSNQQLSVVP